MVLARQRGAEQVRAGEDADPREQREHPTGGAGALPRRNGSGDRAGHATGASASPIP